jgi:lysophospholipase L1-like esterase
MMMERLWVRAAALGIALAVLTSGCAAPSPAPETPTPSAFTSAPSVVAIGDSVPFNSRDNCSGCIGFVNGYTGALGDREGEPYAAVNRSGEHRVHTVDLLEQVRSGALDDDLSDAEVIIISVGLNDQPPYEEGACYDASLELDSLEAVTALTMTTADCIATQTAASGTNFASMLGIVRELAPDASILALTAYNEWTGWPELDALGASVAAQASQVIASSLDAWRSVVCEEAEKVNGECVDLLSAFNGEDGLTPSGDLLAEDYIHPSQKGHDLIRDLLQEH